MWFQLKGLSVSITILQAYISFNWYTIFSKKNNSQLILLFLWWKQHRKHYLYIPHFQDQLSETITEGAIEDKDLNRDWGLGFHHIN